MFSTMGLNPSPPTIAGSITLIVVFILTIPTFLNVLGDVRSKFQAKEYDDGHRPYEDEDGAATEESQKEFSTAIPKYFTLASSIIGFLASATTAVITSVTSIKAIYLKDWLLSGSWSLLLIETLYMTADQDSRRIFIYGRLSATACIAILAALCVRHGAIHSYSNAEMYNVFVALDVVQFVVAALCCFSSLSFPRRPSVFENGHAIDGQFTVSALSKYAFSWAGKTLALARNTETLDLTILPRLHAKARSGYLQRDFESKKKKGSLFKNLMITHRAELVFQAIYAVVQSAAQFAPQIALYWLLKTIERRSTDTQTAKVAWVFVATLGLSIVFASWGQAWAHFIAYARLALPVRSELSAMIFSKATRRKDVKGVQKANTPADLESIPATVPGEINKSSQPNAIVAGPETTIDPAPVIEVSAETADEEDIQKSRQNTINLVGVDATRIADFMLFYLEIPNTVTELTVSIIFLLNIIGWQSLLAGLAVMVVLLPVNVYVSKHFSNTQDELMKVRDQKIVVITEALQGIRQIKFSAEEQQWQEKISKKRDEELRTQWRVFCLDTVLISVWIFGPLMLSAVSLGVYAILQGSLTASVAFTTLSVMANMEFGLAILPEAISEGLEAWISVKRIDNYLKAAERDTYITPGTAVSFEDVSVAWPADSQEEDPARFILRDINISFPPQELSLVSGQTGSGKSLLLAAIIGEADKQSGTIRAPKALAMQDRYDHKANKSNWIIDNATAFVAQIPWIENASIKDNILFGLPFDSGRYEKVIACCALKKDLRMMIAGDMTDIGANGINLSGGQRWRISFARALYSRAGILILDDIFSAVDAHVGRQLFEDAVTGELGLGRTRILVTHHVGLVLPKVKYAVILGQGTVQHAGSVDMLHSTGVLEDLMKKEQESQEKEGKTDEMIIDDTNNTALAKIFSNATRWSNKFDSSEMDIQGKTQPKKFTEDEKRETGRVKLAIYKEYFSTSGGLWLWLPIIILFVVHQSLILGRSWFIGVWTRSYKTESMQVQTFFHQHIPLSITAVGNQVASQDLQYYLSVYFGLTLVTCISGTLRYFLVYMRAIRASKELFGKLTYTVLRAPLRWLDTTPVGRILNRFTADFVSIDSMLGDDLGFLIYQIILLVSIIIAGLFVSPWMLLFAVTLLMLCVYITSTFLAGAREVKRLESNAKSPIFEQFGAALAGIGTIRAFDKVDAYIDRMFEKIDAHAQAFWYIWLFNRWLALRLNWMGAIFAVLVAAVIVLTGIDASLAGFALSFALQYSSAVTWTARLYANVELGLNAVERVDEYSSMPIEDQSASVKVPAAWPAEGRLEVSKLVVAYAPDLDPVLKGLSFVVEKDQRIGVVGRTGAGKSSLTLALFRFLEARSGSIYIDGIDVSKISLYDLRSRLAIIPQDPVLFSGTVRSNLDVFDNHTDAELYGALERVHLISSTGRASRDETTTTSPASGNATPPTAPDSNTNIFRSLASRISEGGLNLSQGQRQLLCLARAIVSRPKIMVLDEATSAVDMATDVLIQRSIRDEFQNRTLIVIAHRLSTIADFDRILVMDDGCAAEFDTPGNLMKIEGGVFRGMVEQSGAGGRLRDIIGGGGEGGGQGRA
ncbi:hypothetical protein N7G274_008987 [Stereocaulon virgatum]|uniref:Uncharacterized protein n=1 Tax=Stereocaulon virgatum TaxID=373712 RepID=A0ABR3ZY80_9LECA